MMTNITYNDFHNDSNGLFSKNPRPLAFFYPLKITLNRAHYFEPHWVVKMKWCVKQTFFNYQTSNETDIPSFFCKICVLDLIG